MTSEQTAPGEEFVVLEDKEGHCDVVPKQAIEAGRVADESVEKLRGLLHDEVSGYSWGAFASPAFTPRAFTEQGIIIVGGYSSFAQHGIIIVGG